MNQSRSPRCSLWTCSLLLLFFYTIFQLCNTVAAQRELVGDKVTAVFAFGDSVMDTGNNNGLLTLVNANTPPYGRDFEHQKVTGRFSNGRVPIDLFAEAFGVKRIVPAYRDPTLQNEDLLTGVSFSSAAAGYDNLTPLILLHEGLDDQIKMLKDYVRKVKAIVGDAQTDFILNNSISIVIAGSDDIVNTYYSTPFRRVQYNIDSYTDLMRHSASLFIKKLHKHGLRKIGIVNVPSVGCIPMQRTLGGGLSRECAKNSNEAALLFNKKLEAVVKLRSATLPNSKLVYIDMYSVLLDMVQNSTKYGLEVVDKGCCGTGLVEVSILCNPFSIVCKDRSKYLFWDSYHPTERGYQILVDKALENNFKYFF